MSSDSPQTNEGCVGNTKDSMTHLSSVLDKLQQESFTEKDDIQLIENMVQDKHFLKLCEVNDLVARSQSFDQPEGSALEAINELNAHAPCSLDQETELLELLKKPLLESLLTVHDKVRSRSYDPPLPAFDPSYHPQTNYHQHYRKRNTNGPDIRTVGLHKSANEPLGITLKLIKDKLVIARVLHGGLIHRQGLLQVGDRIVEVNSETVDSMSPSELQNMLKNSSGSVVIKVEPGFKETAGVTDMFVKAQFDFDPQHDRLIPSHDAGLPFKKGEVLRVLNQDDSFWWQAIKYGENQVAGLIPSQVLEERRKAFNSLDGRITVGCMGKKRPKKKVMYSSHHSAEFECYDLVVYEPVAMVEDFTYKTLILIGAPNIGRRSLKTRLLAEYPERFSDVMAHTTREPRSDDDHRNFHFFTEEQMRLDIMSHKFIEFGKHQQHIYGIKAESVMEVIDGGKMCILDVHPQAVKYLRNSQFCPLVVFIKASSPEGVKRLHHSAKVDGPKSHSSLTEADFCRCYEESKRIERLYSHYFDTTIVNENIDVAYEELLATIRIFSSGKRWVPTNWVM